MQSNSERPDLADCLRQFDLDQKVAAVCIGSDREAGQGGEFESVSPIDGSVAATGAYASTDQLPAVMERSVKAFRNFRDLPAPRRGEFVRRVGELLREAKSELAAIVTWECGKITQEALGEVQEMIDVCDFAVGLSRQLYGLSIASERPQHRLCEYWHPLGPVAVISAFNFPVAVWAWNSMLAWVCGDSVIWKPSEQTPLCALACQRIVQQALAEFDDIPNDISAVVVGTGDQVGQQLAANESIPLVSATGSIPMGRKVAETVARRLGRSLLELGGNNGMIVTPSADLELAVRAIVFSAVGTCGQRCTTLRRLIVHESLRDELVARLQSAYASLPIGDPFSQQTLVGPLISSRAYTAMQDALQAAGEAGAEITGGQRITSGVPEGGFYVQPALATIRPDAEIVQQETFAPILYVMSYSRWDEAIEIHNAVPQGLASAVFTGDVREAERFCSAGGSDCGIVNVNVGPSGAEIGGAFGGEKQTGGGRESGSDSWKAYMRRVTSTTNYSDQLPLAQGIRFEL